MPDINVPKVGNDTLHWSWKAFYSAIADTLTLARRTVNIGSPLVVPAQSTLQHTVTLSGLHVNDFVSVVKPTHQTGLIVGTSRVSDVDTLAITYMNVTGVGITPAAGEIYIVYHYPK